MAIPYDRVKSTVASMENFRIFQRPVKRMPHSPTSWNIGTQLFMASSPKSFDGPIIALYRTTGFDRNRGGIRFLLASCKHFANQSVGNQSGRLQHLPCLPIQACHHLDIANVLNAFCT